MSRARWRYLLEDQDVRRWYNNRARKSRKVADNHLGTLGRELHAMGYDPQSFLKLSDKAIADAVADRVDEKQNPAEGKPAAGNTVAYFVRVVKSWLAWHDRSLKRSIEIDGVGDRPSQVGWHIPVQDELRQVFNACGTRSRASLAFLAFSGVRPEVLADGDRGLRIGDLVDLEIKDGEVVFQEIPLRVVVPTKLSKARHEYFTFLGAEGCDYLQAYLQQRIRSGEELGPESPVIRGKKHHQGFITTSNLSAEIRKAMRSAGLKEAPYIWRSYFDNRAMLGEGGEMLRDYRQFWMGHKGDIEHLYSLHRGELPPDVIQRMRQGYTRCLKYLETRRVDLEAADPFVESVSVILQMNGVTDDDLQDMDLGSMTRGDLIELLQEHHQPVAQAEGPRQRIIPLGELDTALGDGWLFKSELSDGRVLVEAS